MKKGDVVTEAAPARAIVVDPSPLFYEGMTNCLSRGGYVAVGQAHNLEDALQQVDSLHPDLVMVGPNLAEQDSLAVCREVISRWPSIKAIVVTAYADDPLFQADAAYSRAVACLPPEVTYEDCLATIAAVMAGHVLFSREILAEAFQLIRLTTREREVLKLLAEGKADREIADALTVKLSTVRSHSQHVLEKLGVHNRQDAVRRACRRGLI